MASCKNLAHHFWRKRKTVVFFVTPVCLLPLLLMLDSKEAGYGFVAAVTVLYWLWEALPVAVAALLPVLLSPALGLAASATVSTHYISNDSITALSCLALGVAIERCRLGRRVALWILIRAGSSPIWLMLGLMVVTWALSLWLDSTSTTCLSLLLLTPVLRQMKDTKVKRSPSLLARQVVQKALTPKTAVSSSSGPLRSLLSLRRLSKRSENRQSKDEEEMTRMVLDQDELDIKMSPATSKATYRRLCKGLSLCVAFSANIGAACRVTGALPHLSLHQQTRKLYEDYGADSGLTAGDWAVFSLPASVLCLLLAWIWLSLLFLGPKEWRKKKRRDKVRAALIKETLSRQFQKLGPFSFAEKAVLGHFFVLLCLLFAADPPMVAGWLSLYPPQVMAESTGALAVCLSLFVFPAERPRSFFWRSESQRARKVASLLDWKDMQLSFPWRVLLLLGGGQAIVHLWEGSDLWEWVMAEISGRGGGEGGGGGGEGGLMFPWLLSMTLTAVMALLTQIAGSASVSHRLTPVLFSAALSHQMNPLYLLLPCAMATSFTFLLPLATAPNAVVFATDHLKVKDMILAGSVMQVLSVLVLSLAVNTWGMTYFQLHTLPPQLASTLLNVTASWPSSNVSTTATMMTTQTSPVTSRSMLNLTSLVTDVWNATSSSVDV